MAKLQRRLGTVLRHVRKTVTFDGTAGNGAVGTVTLFTITGRVYLQDFTVFCTSTLTGATATISIGDATDVDGLLTANTATNIVTNDWVSTTTSAPGSMSYSVASGDGQGANTPRKKAMSANIIATIATQAVTGGTLVIDVWYQPVTDNGTLTV